MTYASSYRKASHDLLQDPKETNNLYRRQNSLVSAFHQELISLLARYKPEGCGVSTTPDREAVANVATNAILEQRGAKTVLITAKGFPDVLELRRIRMPELYNWNWDKPPGLVERRFRREVNERIDARDAIVRPLDLDQPRDSSLRSERHWREG